MEEEKIERGKITSVYLKLYINCPIYNRLDHTSLSLAVSLQQLQCI